MFNFGGKVDLTKTKSGDPNRRVPKRVKVHDNWYDVIPEDDSNDAINFKLTDTDKNVVYDMTCPYCQDEWYFKVYDKGDFSNRIGDFNTRDRETDGVVTDFEF